MTKRDSQSDLERKIHMVAKNEIGLRDDERQELASYLLRRDVTSWSQLEPHQVCRVADALEGYQLISALLLLRSPTSEDHEHQSDDREDDEDRDHGVT